MLQMFPVQPSFDINYSTGSTPTLCHAAMLSGPRHGFKQNAMTEARLAVADGDDTQKIAPSWLSQTDFNDND